MKSPDPGAASAGSDERSAALACRGCGQPLGTGRWGWGGGPPEAHRERCPVCERVLDRFPAGWVTLGGRFFEARRQDILRTVIACAEAEQAARPGERIERIEPSGDEVRVRTTHARLARRIGDRLQEVYGGQLSYHFEHAPDLLRIDWRRENAAYAAKR